jgi:subtilisin family serine protease
VKVLNALGSGTTSNIIAGIQWAVDDAKSKGRVSKSVISMSLGGGRSDAFNSATASAIKSGIFVAVAAGNDNADASGYSPASEETVSLFRPPDQNNSLALANICLTCIS